MNILRTISTLIIVSLVTVSIGLLLKTQYDVWLFNQGISKAWEAYEFFVIGLKYENDGSVIVDHEWLDWLEGNGGYACFSFAEQLRHAERGGWIDIYPHVSLSPAIFRAEVIGHRRLLAFGIFLLVTVLLLSNRCVKYVHRRKHKLCTKCGYHLDNLSVARCPECGTKFPVEGISSTRPTTKILSDHSQRIIRRFVKVVVILAILLAVVYGFLEVGRRRSINRRIEEYPRLLREEVNRAAAVIETMMEDRGVIDSLRGLRMLHGVLEDEEVSGIIRQELARRMVDGRVTGIYDMLLKRYRFCWDVAEKKWIIPLLESTPNEDVVGKALFSDIVKEEDPELRRLMAIWLGRNYISRKYDSGCSAITAEFKKLFVKEKKLRTKIALAKAIRYCEISFAEEWLEEMVDFHQDQPNETVYKDFEDALYDIVGPEDAYK